MFHPEKPFNQLPPLPTDFNYDQVDILKKVNEANIAVAKLNIRVERLPNSLLLVSPLLVRESVASSGIENINTTVPEVLEAEVFADKRQGPAKEVLFYKSAMQKGLDLIKKNEFLSTNHFVDLQSIIEPSKTGIRKNPVTIQNDTTGEVIYTPPDNEKIIRDLLKNLEDFINNHDDGIDPLVKMAVFHYQFEAIHPFLDGNGRLGRILMILYLVMSERLHFPVLFLSGYVIKHKSQYYKLLKQCSETGDFKEFILFMLSAIEEQAKKTELTVFRIEVLMETFYQKIEEELKINPRDIVKCMFGQPFLTIDYLQEKLGLASRQTASKYLQQLVEIGLLTEQKVHRSKFFYSKRFIKLLS